MKKASWIMIGITFSFLCLLIGIFWGRNSSHGYLPMDQIIASSELEAEATFVPSDGKIDLNTASIEQLQLLPGIGQSIAQRIIDYRSAHNGFLMIEELTHINGIGEKKFDQIKDYIKVGVKYEDSGS